MPPYARRSKTLEVLIPILYLKGVSTGVASISPVSGGDRFFDIFHRHGHRNSTPGLQLEEAVAGNRDVTVLRRRVIDVAK